VRRRKSKAHVQILGGWAPAKSKMSFYRLANKLSLKVADLSALDGDYQRSVQNYEKVAKSSVSK